MYKPFLEKHAPHKPPSSPHIACEGTDGTLLHEVFAIFKVGIFRDT